MIDLGIPKSIEVALRDARIVDKVWGYEFISFAMPKYTFKTMVLKPGYQCSLHFHGNKTESFLAVSGRFKLELPDITRTMEPGDHVNIYPGMTHRFSSEHGAIFYEVSDFDDPKDVVRLEESRKIQ